MYEATRAELAKRRPFEEAARRPYFHIKPLDGVQLFNWIKYLDFMEGRGEPTATQTVYERCLVACANYPGGSGEGAKGHREGPRRMGQGGARQAQHAFGLFYAARVLCVVLGAGAVPRRTGECDSCRRKQQPPPPPPLRPSGLAGPADSRTAAALPHALTLTEPRYANRICRNAISSVIHLALGGRTACEVGPCSHISANPSFTGPPCPSSPPRAACRLGTSAESTHPQQRQHWQQQ